MRSIRWTYVGPRLVALALVAAAVHYGLPPLLRWSLTESGEALVRAKVEIGNVECSLFDPSVIVHDVAVADPNDPWSNLVAADRVALEIEPGSLARKRFVVRRGIVEGLRFDSPRIASGELQDSDQFAPLGRFVESAADRGREWLTAYLLNLGSKIEEDLRQEFRSIGLAEELAGRWPSVYAQYDAQVKDLLARGRATEARIRAARENPLRNLAALQEATQEIERLNQDLGKLIADLEQLEPQLESDREAVWAAWEADRQKLAEGFSFEAVDARAVSDYLLQEEVAGRVGTMFRWVERIRRLVPLLPTAPEPVRGRGVNVLFAGLREHPDYLVRSLDLRGRGRSGGEPYTMSGTIIGLSTQPARYGRPTIAKIIARGSVNFDIEASLDRTRDEPIDRFAFDGPFLQRTGVELGEPKSFAVVLEDGRDEIHADLTLKGSELAGSLTLSMHTDGLRVQSDRSQSAIRLAEALGATLSGIETIDTTLHVEGTLAEPSLRMESTLGSQVLAAVQEAVTEEVAARRQELELALRRKIETQLSEVEHLAADQRRQLEHRLNEQQTALIRLAADTFGLGNRPTIRLGSSDAAGKQSEASESTYQR